MRIETLTTSLQLFEVNRNREYYRMREIRRTFWQMVGIFLVLSALAVAIILYL